MAQEVSLLIATTKVPSLSVVVSLIAEVTLEEAISHLIKCRKVSQDEIWHFRPNVLTISIKRPVHLVGLRNGNTADENSFI